MRRLVIVIIVCSAGFISCRTSNSAQETDFPELPFANGLQDAIDQVLVTNQNHHELGISAAVVVPGYATWTGVSGYSHQNVPITPGMLFDVGSIQKNFEAALVLKLAEEGVLSLDDPIDRYLPTYRNVDGRITIRQLLNHTSGVYNVFEHPDFPWVKTNVDYAEAWEEEEVFNSFVLDPYGPPGYAQHYSSTNYLLITAIIEEVTGSTVPDEMEQAFLYPLKLKHTFVSMGQLPPARYAVAHPWVDIDQDGKLDDLHGTPRTWIATLTHPVMFSTAEDLTYWLNALYHDRAILSSSSMLGYSAAALYLPEYGISIAWLINTGKAQRNSPISS